MAKFPKIGSFDEITPKHAPYLAQRFVDLTESVEGILLDYSVDSLEQVDQIIEGMRREGLKLKDIYGVITSAGCYVGEILARNLDMRWVRIEDSSLHKFFGHPAIVMETEGGGATSPIDKVIKRLEVGKGDYIPAYYQVLLKLIKDGPPPYNKQP